MGEVDDILVHFDGRPAFFGAPAKISEIETEEKTPTFAPLLPPPRSRLSTYSDARNNGKMK